MDRTVIICVLQLILLLQNILKVVMERLFFLKPCDFLQRMSWLVPVPDLEGNFDEHWKSLSFPFLLFFFFNCVRL